MELGRLQLYGYQSTLAINVNAIHCCGQLILQGRKTQNQNDNHVLQVNLHCTKSFISSVTMETAKICSFTSHLRNMQNILATAVIYMRCRVQTLKVYSF
jgi:hypothetical protein